MREACAFSNRTEVHDGDTLLTRYDDLIAADAFGQRWPRPTLDVIKEAG